MPNCCTPLPGIGPWESHDDHPQLLVEIKPKCGFLPTSAAIPAADDVKRRVSRFQLHQRLKLAQASYGLLTRAEITI